MKKKRRKIKLKQKNAKFISEWLSTWFPSLSIWHLFIWDKIYLKLDDPGTHWVPDLTVFRGNIDTST